MTRKIGNKTFHKGYTKMIIIINVLTKTKNKNNWEIRVFIEWECIQKNLRRFEKNIFLLRTILFLNDSWTMEKPECRDFYQKSFMTYVQRDLFVQHTCGGETHNLWLAYRREEKIHPYEIVARGKSTSLMTKLRCNFSLLLLLLFCHACV